MSDDTEKFYKAIFWEDVEKMVRLLLDHLPDSSHFEDESWRWAWDELSGEAQAKVKVARKEAAAFLTALLINQHIDSRQMDSSVEKEAVEKEVVDKEVVEKEAVDKE